MLLRAWLPLFTFFLTLLSICNADDRVLIANEDYNNGFYGDYPTHTYHSSKIKPPRLNFMQPFTNCDDGSYIFLTPRGRIANSSFYILDHEGSLIWGPDHRYGEVYNFQVQNFRGEPYLIFWAGDDSVGGHGEGKYYMLDKHYEEHRSFSAGNDMRGDLHAFYFTEDDTAIYTGYDKVGKDLSSLGAPEDGYIWDSLFQELDVATGEVIFQWRASDHFSFADVSVKPNKATKKDPWDWFHINMVEKDRDGNFLVSTRYGRCALYISGKTGEVLWQLGGNKNSFIDLSNGDATTFLGQHDIHWAEGHKYITVFDNRADWYHRIENHSRGHKIEIDLEKMTAKLIQSYTHPVGILSTSQGSMQMLPNGNVLMGYGFTGVLTEFSPDGEALCDAYMQPSKRFGSGEVQSYRDLKFNWTGIPLTTPDIAYHRGSVYMSWLGSTKVRSWLLQDSDTADGLYESVQSTPKQGFETQFTLNLGKRMRQYVRAIAVDEGGTQLSISPPVDLVNSTEIWGKKPANMLEDDDHDDMEVDYAQDVEDVQVLLVLGGLALISGLLIAWMTIGLRRKRGWGAKSFASINRAAWQRVRSGLAGTSKYRDDSSAGSELLSRRRDSDTSLGDDEMVNFSREDFRLYDRTGYQ